MTQYTSKERVEAAFKGKMTDRLPVALGLTAQLVQQAGISLNEYLMDPEKQFATLQVSEKLVPTDMIRVPGDPLLPMVTQAMKEQQGGGEAARARVLDDKSNIEKYNTVRDPRESKSYKKYLELATRTREKFPDRFIVALVPGPWSTAVEMRGIEKLTYDTADEPDFVHRLMRITTAMNRARAVALAERGVALRFGDPSAGCSLISPRIYRAFVKPYHTELFNTVKQQFPSTYIGLHICGYTDPIMEDLCTLNIDWMELDSPSSLKKWIGICGKKIALRGNVSAEAFYTDNKQKMEEEVKKAVEIAAPGGAFIIAPGCSVPLDAPFENIKYFLGLANKYGNLEYIKGLS